MFGRTEKGTLPFKGTDKKKKGGVFFIETSVFVGRASARQGRLMGGDAEGVHKFSGFEWRRYAAHCTITRHVDSSGAMPVGYCALRELLDYRVGWRLLAMTAGVFDSSGRAISLRN